MNDRCDICSGPLYVDEQSVAQLARHGYEGARIYCRLGCTDVWIKRRVVTAPTVAEPDPRGRYLRPVRTFHCVRCGAVGKTRGYRTRWCGSCAVMHRRERERVSYSRERQRRASAG